MDSLKITYTYQCWQSNGERGLWTLNMNNWRFYVHSVIIDTNSKHEQKVYWI